MLRVRATMVTSVMPAGSVGVLGERMWGSAMSDESRRCLAVAVRAARGGRRWEGPGERMDVRNWGCGAGRPSVVRAEVRRGRVGCAAMLISLRYDIGGLF